MIRHLLASTLTCLLIGLNACSSFSAARSPRSNNPYCQGTGTFEELRCQLAQAQQAKNQAQVQQVNAQVVKLLGTQAGMPETPEKFVRLNSQSPQLANVDVSTAFIPYGKRIRREAWWRQRPQPTELKFPLRAIASVMTGTLAARRAGSEYPDQLLAIARSAGDYLMWAQTQGGRGVIPLPDLRGESGRVPELITTFLERAQATGQLSQVLVKGWIVDDLGGGDLQFDNGVCGVALLDLYEATGDRQYLNAAIKAADWAIAQPVVPNWNYNSFSVFLLARTYQVTQDTRYLDSAKEKARLGLYPGQLTSGSRQGWWADPHNARLVYHYFMIRGLGALVAVMSDRDPDFPKARQVLTSALQVANSEILKQGITEPDYVLEVLSRLELSFPAAGKQLADGGRTQTLDLVGRYVNGIFSTGKLPVSPGAWGLYLESLAH